MNVEPIVIRADRVVTPSGVITGGAVRMEGGQIAAVNRAAWVPVEGAVAVLEGAALLPGFIDLHVHGYGGHDFGGGAHEAREAARRIVESGVTTCYAGLGAGGSLVAIAAVVAGAAAVDEDTGGARLAGIFMEGPFISAAKHGAWNPEHVRPPSIADMRVLVAAARGRIRRFNVAPELPGAIAFIHAARAEGIAVSLGHSDATYEQAVAAIEAGATITNHTFNAMSAFDHRRPGLTGATFARDELLAELILDGVHVHAAAALALFRARGAGGIALITDGLHLTGAADGVHGRGEVALTVRDGACRLPDGTLAGSVSPFDRDLRNAARILGADLAQLAAISSANAARAMGIGGRTAAIAPGFDADLVLLDSTLHVLATIVGGRVVYRRPAMA